MPSVEITATFTPSREELLIKPKARCVLMESFVALLFLYANIAKLKFGYKIEKERKNEPI